MMLNVNCVFVVVKSLFLRNNRFLSLLNADDADNADFYFVESKMIANYEKEFYLYKSPVSSMLSGFFLHTPIMFYLAITWSML